MPGVWGFFENQILWTKRLPRVCCNIPILRVSRWGDWCERDP